MNYIVKDIIKAVNTSSKEEREKTLVLSKLLDKTEHLIEIMQTPQRELDFALDQQRRYLMSEVEDRMYRMEMEIFSRLKLLLDGGRNPNEF